MIDIANNTTERRGEKEGVAIYYGWIIAGAGLIISLMGIGIRYCFGVFLESIEAEFGLARGATSSIFSLYMLLCLFLAVAGGWALDKYGPRKVGLFVAAFTGMSLVTTSQIREAWHLLLSYSLLLAVGTGPIYTLANSTTSRWFNERRGLAVGISSSGGGLGAIVLSPLAAYLISAYDWRIAFLVLGIIAWMVMGSTSLLLKSDPLDLGLLQYGEEDEFRPKTRDGGDGKTGVGGRSFREALRMSQLWFLSLTWFFFSLSLHLVFVHTVPYAMKAGISAVDAAVVIAIIGGSNIPGRILLGQLSDMWGRKAIAIGCSLIQGGSLIWLIWSKELWMFYLFAIVFGFLWGGFGTISTALTGDVFGTQSLGSIMGIMSAFWAVGAATGPAVGGYIFDAYNSYVLAFLTGAIAIFATIPLVGFLRRVHVPGEAQ
ncbi:MAG: MFS transporter [Deltaproteobacteria bacterium]|nr:MFS transporter [Deltaproteobacteria bacterium]